LLLVPRIGAGRTIRKERCDAMEGEERRAYLSAWLYCCDRAFGSVGGLDIVATASCGLCGVRWMGQLI